MARRYFGGSAHSLMSSSGRVRSAQLALLASALSGGALGLGGSAAAPRLPVTRALAARAPRALAARAVADRDAAALDAHLFAVNAALVGTVKGAIDRVYGGHANAYARFYVLETVARVPYFAYLSVMHLYESLGRRRPGDTARMRTHYAEADNELHHLLIMEALGGNASAFDRALAQTLAFGYYWYVVGVYLVSEPAACARPPLAPPPSPCSPCSPCSRRAARGPDVCGAYSAVACARPSPRRALGHPTATVFPARPFQGDG
jgi:hypothetical protein